MFAFPRAQQAPLSGMLSPPPADAFGPWCGVAAVTPKLCCGSCFEQSQVSCEGPGVAGIPREQAFPFPGSFPFAQGAEQSCPHHFLPHLLWSPGAAGMFPRWSQQHPCLCGILPGTQGSGESGADLGWMNVERGKLQALP